MTQYIQPKALRFFAGFVALALCIWSVQAGPVQASIRDSGADVAAAAQVYTAQSLRLPMALDDSSPDKETPATHNGEEASPSEKMLSGSFLGALLFGHPYKSIGSIDIVALGLLFLLVVRLIAARRRAAGQDDSRGLPDSRNTGNLEGGADKPARSRVEDLRPNALGESKQPPLNNGAAGNPADNAWSRKLRGEPARPENQAHKRPAGVQENAAAMWKMFASDPERQASPEAATVAAGVALPPDFDVDDFLKGARTLYVRLQQSWAARKVDDLTPFVTPQMLQVLQKQAAANPDPVKVEVLLVNATLAGLQSEAERERAEVAFSVLMRTGEDEEPAEINEIWTFSRSGDSDGMWRLEGIRQE